MIWKMAPCKGCEERKAGCHADCVQYQEWNGERLAQLEACRKEKIKQQEVTRRKQAAIARYKRRQRK